MTYTVTGTRVHKDGTPVPNTEPATFDLTIGTDGEVRYVDNTLVDGLGYVRYRVTHLTWQTNEILESPALQETEETSAFAADSIQWMLQGLGLESLAR